MVLVIIIQVLLHFLNHLECLPTPSIFYKIPFHKLGWSEGHQEYLSYLFLCSTQIISSNLEQQDEILPKSVEWKGAALQSFGHNFSSSPFGSA